MLNKNMNEFYSSKIEDDLYLNMIRVTAENYDKWIEYLKRQRNLGPVTVVTSAFGHGTSPFNISKYDQCQRYVAFASYEEINPSIFDPSSEHDMKTIEMLISVTTFEDATTFVNLGIARGVSPVIDKRTPHKNLAMRLHSFVGQALQYRATQFGETSKLHMMSYPNGFMQLAILASLLDTDIKLKPNTYFQQLSNEKDLIKLLERLSSAVSFPEEVLNLLKSTETEDVLKKILSDDDIYKSLTKPIWDFIKTGKPSEWGRLNYWLNIIASLALYKCEYDHSNENKKLDVSTLFLPFHNQSLWWPAGELIVVHINALSAILGNCEIKFVPYVTITDEALSTITAAKTDKTPLATSYSTPDTPDLTPEIHTSDSLYQSLTSLLCCCRTRRQKAE